MQNSISGMQLPQKLIRALQHHTSGYYDCDIGQLKHQVQAHLSKLASAQGLYAFPDPGGRLEFKKIDTSGSIATLTEENPVVDTIESSFDVTKRFWEYVAVGTFQGNPISI